MNMRNLFLTLAFGLCSGVFALNTTVFESPIMGWSSWNTYRVHINDTLIIRQADAMVQKGLKEVGYSYVNIDDGFFGCRNEATRTPDPYVPNVVRYQLRYIPIA